MHRTIFASVLFAVVALAPAAALSQKKDEPAAKDRFELRQGRVGKVFEAIRFNVRTGESWRISGDNFEKLPETGPVPAGNYDIALIATDDDWIALRFDRVSGTTWILRARQWVRVKEPGEGKAA